MPTVEEVLLSTSDRMQKSVDSLERDLGAVRTGRASATLVENLMVNYYGTDTPLNQLSSITIPEARTTGLPVYNMGQSIQFGAKVVPRE